MRLWHLKHDNNKISNSSSSYMSHCRFFIFPSSTFMQIQDTFYKIPVRKQAVWNHKRQYSHSAFYTCNENVYSTNAPGLQAAASTNSHQRSRNLP